ncbi:MAG: hypothetical protein OEV44_12065, partial [Spirochaetota bacterium]|nr:hypothetical protein [Spirochaetota bacterium]
MQKLVISFILVFVLIGLDSTSYTQELSKIRAGKKKIIKLLNKSKDEDYLEKKLKSFDTTILRQLLKDYKISVKDKNKSELIELIIEKIPLLLNKTNQGKMKITKEKKEKTKEKKTENQDRRSEIKNIESKKSNKFITYQAERIYAIDKEDEKGFRKIFLFGHVVIEFHSKTLYADAVSIKINKEDEPIEVVAQGDLLIEDKKYHRIIGKKMYFFPQIKRGIIFSANALNNPFYLTGKRGNQIDKSKYIMYDGNMTSCNLAYPHYSLNYSKAWYYDEEQIWAINVEYNIGDTALFYFPFFFRSAETTGIRTAFGYEKGIGWFLHNTLVYVPGKSIAESRK